MRSDPKKLVRRLTPTATRMLEGAVGRAASSQHAEVTVEHMLHQMLADSKGECAGLLHEYGQNAAVVSASLDRLLSRAASSASARPVFSELLFRWFEDAWLSASLEFGMSKLRTGVLLYQFVSSPGRYSGASLDELDSLSADKMKRELVDLLANGAEATEAEVVSVASAGGGGAAAPGGGGSGEALARFCRNFTGDAAAGRIDPIFGRHREIRQMIDVLSRRRKNNPIIVGEPGVGKTALVEGLALELIAGNVPSHLRKTELWGLDLGLLQAGASVRGEFENRLKAVISDVQSAEKPIILFIDEAHTLIGAGGQQGGGDAANLLKPALARGELRTIAATTWAEYKKYFEKDAALERRFQPVKVDEPSEEDAIVMLRGLAPVYEKSHGVRILDEAVVAAVRLSSRYIAGRQLPDKAVDLLDTTAARVRTEHEAKPESLVDVEQRVAALARAATAIERDVLAEVGGAGLKSELDQIQTELAATRAELETLTAQWQEAKVRLQAELARRAASAESGKQGGGAVTPAVDGGAEESLPGAEAPADAAASQESPGSVISVDVTADAVAGTVSSWTGIPLGSMQRGSMGTGVLLFVGPSGVGKTETALALADLLYGGERFMTTINMSEFQEKHTVSRLIGSPPGYVGYGEGGVLTEAVRQRPYSVVLLDEVEKADPEVMNLFYQVFDKGMLSDGEGRSSTSRTRSSSSRATSPPTRSTSSQRSWPA
jgi:type VI secretion system protein VasG